MTTCARRISLLALIEHACRSGARLRVACDLISLHVRTLQRWKRPQGQHGDRRAAGKRRVTIPPNKLSEVERAQALQVLNSEPFKDLPPSQAVPRLADQGRYVASESTLYYLLREAGQLAHRRLERAAHQRHKPRALTATAPNQIYCWDTQSTIGPSAAFCLTRAGIGEMPLR